MPEPLTPSSAASARCAGILVLFDVELAVTPLDQLRLRLPAHDFDRLMQAAKPVAEPDRDALLKDIAAELGQHEVVGPGLLHRVISEVQRRY